MTATDWVDISSNNAAHGPIDVNAYAATGRTFLMRKVSEGTGYHWAGGDTIADQCHQAGLAVGHYHWLRPDQNAADQADWFLTQLGAHYHGAADVLMTDFERTDGVADPGDAARAEQLLTFNAAVLHSMPTADLTVYTGNWYIDAMGAQCAAAVREYDVILSDYTAAADTAIDNPHGLSIVARQFTNQATVPGIPGQVDCNRWLSGSHVALGGGTIITPPTTTTPFEDDMPSFLVGGKTSAGTASGHNWIVAGDYSKRKFCNDPGNAAQLAGDWNDGKPFINAAMSYAELVGIPDVTVRFDATGKAIVPTIQGVT